MQRRTSTSAQMACDAKSWFQFNRSLYLPDAIELRGRRFLVVEDEYVIAADLAASLEALGVEVVGPASSVAEALALLENDREPLDGAVLDINLGSERAYPVADVLRDLGIPYVFTTGYDAAV